MVMWASMVVPDANLPQCRGEFVSVRDRFPCQFPPHPADESFHPAILPRTSRLDSHDRGWSARDATGPANPSSPGDRHPISDCVASTTDTMLQLSPGFKDHILLCAAGVQGLGPQLSVSPCLQHECFESNDLVLDPSGLEWDEDVAGRYRPLTTPSAWRAVYRLPSTHDLPYP